MDVSTQRVIKGVNESAIPVRHLQVEPVLTAQHCTALWAFAREH